MQKKYIDITLVLHMYIVLLCKIWKYVLKNEIK